MLRLLHGTKFDFIRLQRFTAIFTAALIIPGMLWIAATGVNYSIEFTGGTLVQAEFTNPVQADDVRAAVTAGGVQGPEVQSYGKGGREWVIRAQGRAEVAEQAQGAEVVGKQIAAALTQRFGAGTFRVKRTEAIGPKVGSELRQKALMAVLLSFLVVLIYLAWRFEWRFGVAAVAATGHDILATLAFAKYLDLEISLIVVGAFLTVLGYSLNDTIVIFDRIRENLRDRKRETMYELINRSVNETLPRTVITGVTTIGAILALLVFAGPVIRPFALVLLFGILIGTYSSIYVAAPILLLIEKKWPHKVDEKTLGHRKRVTSEEPVPPKPRGQPVGTSR